VKRVSGPEIGKGMEEPGFMVVLTTNKTPRSPKGYGKDVFAALNS
jgi:hypothetical protein